MGTHPVLVVEDDELIRDSLVEYLDEQGYQAMGAVDGLDALDKLRRGGPLTRNDLVNLFDRNLGRTRLDRALTSLLAAGLARREEKRDTGGRPAEVWHAT